VNTIDGLFTVKAMFELFPGTDRSYPTFRLDPGLTFRLPSIACWLEFQDFPQ
jgi:hypothetical protein